jgi:hypothetical protein
VRTLKTLPSGSARALCIGLAAVATLLVAAQASSTTVIRAGIPELVDRATLVVEGTVTSEQVVSDQPLPHTEYTVAIARTWKGDPLEALVVRIPGGGHTVMVGAPKLVMGSRVLLLLEPGTGGTWVPLGLGQGHFVLDQGHFQRNLDDVIFLDRSFCTGGEFLGQLDAASLRSYLRQHFGAPQ